MSVTNGESHTNLASGAPQTHQYGFDSSGMNIRTQAQAGPAAIDYQTNVTGGAYPAVGSGGIDTFARVIGESSTDATRRVQLDGSYTLPAGTPAGSAPSIRTTLQPSGFADIYPLLPVQQTASTATSGSWDSPYAHLRPSSSYELKAHISLGTAATSSSKPVSLGRDASLTALATVYDAQGRVIRRVLGASGSTLAHTRTQWLTWDHLDRLIGVEERAVASAATSPVASTLGYSWTALYDGLGRRLRTTLRYLNSNGLAIADLEQVETSTYDIAHEFLEIRVSRTYQDAGTESGITYATQTQSWWKVHGPDGSGTYGGHNGMGGLEAVYEVDSSSSVKSWSILLDDVYGHIIGSIEVKPAVGSVAGSATYRRSPTQSLGYGPAPGAVVAQLTGSVTGSLAQATNWHGRRQDVTGYYYLGARYYEPTGGRFLSADPAGHSASLSLYDYAAGDPVNFMDADGRNPTKLNDSVQGWSNFDSAVASTTAESKPGHGVLRPGSNGNSLFDGRSDIAGADTAWDSPSSNNASSGGVAKADIKLNKDFEFINGGLQVGGINSKDLYMGLRNTGKNELLTETTITLDWTLLNGTTGTKTYKPIYSLLSHNYDKSQRFTSASGGDYNQLTPIYSDESRPWVYTDTDNVYCNCYNTGTLTVKVRYTESSNVTYQPSHFQPLGKELSGENQSVFSNELSHNQTSPNMPGGFEQAVPKTEVIIISWDQTSLSPIDSTKTTTSAGDMIMQSNIPGGPNRANRIDLGATTVPPTPYTPKP